VVDGQAQAQRRAGLKKTTRSLASVVISLSLQPVSEITTLARLREKGMEVRGKKRKRRERTEWDPTKFGEGNDAPGHNTFQKRSAAPIRQ